MKSQVNDCDKHIVQTDCDPAVQVTTKGDRANNDDDDSCCCISTTSSADNDDDNEKNISLFQLRLTPSTTWRRRRDVDDAAAKAGSRRHNEKNVGSRHQR